MSSAVVDCRESRPGMPVAAEKAMRREIPPRARTTEVSDSENARFPTASLFDPAIGAL
jgi:hypothetical protein